MVTIATLRKLALSFPETSEEPHFEKTSFRVGKKIFATYDSSTKLACLKLSALDQDVFSLFDKTVIYPVPGKWGMQGWTLVNLSKVRKDMFTDALTTAYCQVAPKKLVALMVPAGTEEQATPPKKAATPKSNKNTASATAGTVASDTAAVDDYMQQLQHPLHDVATALRKLILSTHKTIGEEIAWNAPSFFYTGPMPPFTPKEYRRLILNFNLFQKNCVRLVFLHGANATDPSGMLEGDYKDGRRLALFHNMEEVKQKEKHLRDIIKQLLAQIDK